MKSPLAADAALVKEFNIEQTIDLDGIFKIAYVRAQIEELQKAMFRNRVDALLSMDLADRSQAAKDEAMENKARENLVTYRNFIKQTSGGLKFLEQYLSELEAEYPAE